MNRLAAAFAAKGPLLGVEPFRAALEFAWPNLTPPALPTPGDGHPVVIFPGLGADGSSVTVLRDHCRALGYTAFDWGQGFNIGPQGHLDTWLHGLAHRVSRLLADHAKPATFIGWSLGGLYARELGKLLVPRLRQVITATSAWAGTRMCCAWWPIGWAKAPGAGARTCGPAEPGSGELKPLKAWPPRA